MTKTDRESGRRGVLVQAGHEASGGGREEGPAGGWGDGHRGIPGHDQDEGPPAGEEEERHVVDVVCVRQGVVRRHRVVVVAAILDVVTPAQLLVIADVLQHLGQAGADVADPGVDLVADDPQDVSLDLEVALVLRLQRVGQRPAEVRPEVVLLLEVGGGEQAAPRPQTVDQLEIGGF